MPRYLFRRPETLDLSNPAIQKLFVEEVRSGFDLIEKELAVNLSSQNLLGKRIAMMQSFVNDLPSSDPQYSMLLIQIQMDRVELDELKLRNRFLREQITE
jgi:hypothetical protein